MVPDLEFLEEPNQPSQRRTTVTTNSTTDRKPLPDVISIDENKGDGARKKRTLHI